MTIQNTQPPVWTVRKDVVDSTPPSIDTLDPAALGDALGTRQDAAEAAAQRAMDKGKKADDSPKRFADLDEPVWLEIRPKAIEQNIARVQRKLNKKTRLCAVVKGDAYGHGIDNVLRATESAHVDAYGIADNREARAIRRAGIRKPILRLRAASQREMKRALDLDVEESIGSLAVAKQLSALGEQHTKKLPIHLNLNSGGMARNGFDMTSEAGRKHVIETLKLPGIACKGIYSHFSNAHETGDDYRDSLDRFLKESSWILEHSALDRDAVLLHVANTAATFRSEDTHLDMVRVGGALYGTQPPVADEPPMHAAMSVHTEVAAVLNYPKGSSVGYGGTETLTRASRLANLPIGHQNGLPSEANGTVDVLIRGERFPILGGVGMNTTLVDVTDATSAIRPGDKVTLVGVQGDEAVDMNELKDKTGVPTSTLFRSFGAQNHAARITRDD